jgi:hypothetical protein
MSRYSKEIDERHIIAYGFDNYSGYFFQKFDELTEDDEEHVVMNECSRFTGLSNGRMVELMKKHEVNEDHIQMVIYDLPF